MKLEDISKKNVSIFSDRELHELRDRANQLDIATNKWRVEIGKRNIGVTDPIPRDDFLRYYSVIFDEMAKRGLRTQPTDADRRLMSKRMRGMDPADFPPIVVQDAAVAFTGDFVTDPRGAGIVDMFVTPWSMENCLTDLEKQFAKKALEETGKPVRVSREIPEGKAIPLYDVVLVPRGRTEEVESLFGHAEDSMDLRTVEARLDLPTRPLEEFLAESGLTKEHAKAVMGAIDRMRSSDLVAGPNLEAGRKLAKEIEDDEAVDVMPISVSTHVLEGDLEAATKMGFVKNEEQHLVGGIVYEVGVVDAQGDVIDSDQDIWKAMESWALGGHTMKVMHNKVSKSVTPVESFQAEEDTFKGGGIIPKGAWYMTCKVDDDELWKACRNGEITGFSMAGKSMAHMREE